MNEWLPFFCSYHSGSSDYEKASTGSGYYKTSTYKASATPCASSSSYLDSNYMTPLHNVRRNVASRSMYKDSDQPSHKSSIG